MEQRRIQELIGHLGYLTEGQIFWIEKVTEQFQRPFLFTLKDSDIFTEQFVQEFGDTLRIHHCFSNEAFTKDKFEYAMEQCFQMIGSSAQLATRGNPGHDITVQDQMFSLKTQADKNIKAYKIHISKFMELGTGAWGDDPNDLFELRDKFFIHLQSYDRIFTLRRIAKEPQLHYELVEIPKSLLLEAENGQFEMMINSKQSPKPGYCRVYDQAGIKKFELYFDGGTERKLQIKNLAKEYCVVHAEWRFETSNVITT